MSLLTQFSLLVHNVVNYPSPENTRALNVWVGLHLYDLIHALQDVERMDWVEKKGLAYRGAIDTARAEEKET